MASPTPASSALQLDAMDSPVSTALPSPSMRQSSPGKRAAASGATVATSNDFLRTQYEIDAPNRRGGLNAAAILQHLPEAGFTELKRQWNQRLLAADEFVELLRPMVISAGYFDASGARVDEAWSREGWVPSTMQGARGRESIRGGIHDAYAQQQRRRGLTDSSSLDDATHYLLDVYDVVRTEARTPTLSWGDFTLFLVDGISSLSKNTGGASSSADEDVRYAFRGEIPVTGGGTSSNSDTSREWYSHARYVPSMDSLVTASRSSVRLISRTTGVRPISMDLPRGTVVSTADYVESKDLCVAATFQRELHFWSVHRGRAKHVLQIPPPVIDPNTIVSSMLVTGSRLWCGARDGTLLSSLVGQRGYGKYYLADNHVRSAHTDAITSIYKMPHNNTIVTSSLDKTLFVFDAVGGVGRDKETVVKGHAYGVLTLEFSQNASVLLSGGFESRVLVWADNLWKTPIFTLQDPGHPLDTVIGIKALPSTPYVAVGDAKGTLKLFDLRKRLVVYTLDISDPDNFDAGLVRRDHLRRQADAADAGMMNDGGSSTTKRSAGAGGGSVGALAGFNQAAALFSSFEYTGSQHRELVFGGSRMFYFSMASDTQEDPTLTYSTNRRFVGAHGLSDAVLTVADNEFALWSAATGVADVRRKLALSSPVCYSQVLDPPGEIVLLGHDDGSFSTHHLGTGLPLREVSGGHDEPIVAMATNPSDELSLCTASADRRLCFWNIDLRIAEPAPGMDNDKRTRVIPRQSVVLDADSIITVRFIGDQGSVLAVLCARSVAFWTYYKEYRRWVHQHDLPVGLAGTPSTGLGLGAAAPRSLGGAVAVTVEEPKDTDSTVGRSSTPQSSALSPVFADAAKRKARRDRLLKKQARRPTYHQKTVASVPGVEWTGGDVIVGSALSPHPQRGYDGRQQLLCLVTDDGIVKLWSINTSSAASQLYANGCAPSVAAKKLEAHSKANLKGLVDFVLDARQEDGAVSPKLHCADFSALRPHLLVTGDDLGRLTVWILPEEAETPRGFTPIHTPPWVRHHTSNGRLESLVTHQVHNGPITEARFVQQPIDGIVSFGEDSLACISSWDGVLLARLQQGPLVSRTWCLPRDRGYSWKSMQAKLRVERLKDVLADNVLQESIALVAGRDIHGDTVPSTPAAAGLGVEEDDDFATTVGGSSVAGSTLGGTPQHRSGGKAARRASKATPLLSGSRLDFAASASSPVGPASSPLVLGAPADEATSTPSRRRNTLAVDAAEGMGAVGGHHRRRSSVSSLSTGSESQASIYAAQQARGRTSPGRLESWHHVKLPSRLMAPVARDPDSNPDVVAASVPARPPDPPSRIPKANVSTLLVGLHGSRVVEQSNETLPELALRRPGADDPSPASKAAAGAGRGQLRARRHIVLPAVDRSRSEKREVGDGPNARPAQINDRRPVSPRGYDYHVTAHKAATPEPRRTVPPLSDLVLVRPKGGGVSPTVAP